VFDLQGARVRTLASGRRAAGAHRVEWRGDDERGRALPPGVYLARFRSGGVDVRRKLVRLE
jgi:flagellar hook assembly protein FlgD